MDFEAHRQALVAHFVWLYRHAYAGPEQARAAMTNYVNRPGCLFPTIGRDVRKIIDAQDLEEK